MRNSTGTGRGPAHGSMEHLDGDPRQLTMGESASQEDPPVGSELDAAVPDEPVPGGRPQPGSAKGDAARGVVPKP